MTDPAKKGSNLRGLKEPPRQLIPVAITEINPVLPGLVKDVGENLEGLINGIATNAEPDHVRLCPPRRPVVSDTEVEAIRAAGFGVGEVADTLPRWQKDSIVIWFVELMQAEVLRRRRLAVNPRQTTAI